MDIDQTVKNIQRRNLWSWLRKFRDYSNLAASRQALSISALPRNREKVPKMTGREKNSSIPMEADNTRNMQLCNKFLVIEIGCGDTVHGLRQESELLLSSHPISGIMHSKLIRINPDLKDNALYSYDVVESFSNNFQEKLLEASSMESQGDNNVEDKKIRVKDLDDNKLIDAECSWRNSGRILNLKTSALEAIQNIFG